MQPDKHLARQFRDFDPAFSQEGMQQYLEQVYKRAGLPDVLDALTEWSERTGYVAVDALYSNRRFIYPDPATGLNFRAQINYARDGYSPVPPASLDLPPLHCPLCIENIGRPGKERLRVFCFALRDRPFFVQLTPFPLFKKHFVLVEQAISPMRMNGESVRDLLAFMRLAPGYVCCSNSDVAWAGASILEHHHYQVFAGLDLPVMHALANADCAVAAAIRDEPVEICLLNFPIACCKVSSKLDQAVAEAGSRIIAWWKDKDPGQNTCNLIAYENSGQPELLIFFRNPNFRTRDIRRGFKSEGVGVIEVAGEGIYPVPKGKHAEEMLREISENGLQLIRGIIADNNPVPETNYADFFRELVQIFQI